MGTLQAETTSSRDATATHKAEVESLEQRVSEITAHIETQLSLHRSTEESHTATRADLAVRVLQCSTPALFDNEFMTFDLLSDSQTVQAAAQASAEEVLEAHRKVQEITSELEVRLFVNLCLVGQEDVLTLHLLSQSARAELEALRSSTQTQVGDLEAKIQQLTADIEATRESRTNDAAREQELEDLKASHQSALTEALALSASDLQRLREEHKVRLLHHCSTPSSCSALTRLISQTHFDGALEQINQAHGEELEKLRASQTASLEEAIAAAKVDAAESVETEWVAKQDAIKQELDALLHKSSSELAEKDGFLLTIKSEVEVRSIPYRSVPLEKV